MRIPTEGVVRRPRPHSLAAAEQADDETDAERGRPGGRATEHAPEAAVAMEQANEPGGAEIQQEGNDVAEIDRGAEADGHRRATRVRRLAEPVERGDGGRHETQPETGVDEAHRETERPDEREGEEPQPR